MLYEVITLVPGQEILAEGLGAFQLGGGLSRAEDGKAGGTEGIERNNFV